MRPFAVLCAVTLMSVVLAAPLPCSADSYHDSCASEDNLTHGCFALLVLKVIDTQPGVDLTPVEALVEAKDLDLVPDDWREPDVLTHGEIADFLEIFGVHYQPADRDEPSSRPFTEAILRRHLSKLKDYLARRMGHGVSVAHVLDEGVDRAVSPIYP